MKNISVIILAAGEGKRMKSEKSKVLCNVLFKPMINWVLDNCKNIGCKNEDICIICPTNNEDIIKGTGNKFLYVIQKERLGTAHAIKQAHDFIINKAKDDILILLGDVPLISDEVLKNFCQHHVDKENSMTVLSSNVENSFGYGRIIRDANNNELVCKIVEEIDCSEEEKNINEINSGVMCFKKDDLLLALDEIKNNNAKGEFYITSSIDVLLRHNKRVGVYNCNNSVEVLGANDRNQLLKLNAVAQKKVIEKLLNNGIEFVSLDGVVIGPDVKIGCGTLIYPGVMLTGGTIIGKNCVITSGSNINNSIIGDYTIIKSSYIDDSTVGSSVKIGPFSNIRPNCHINDEVKIGDFVEVKNSTVSKKTSIAHLTYVGDSDIGEKVNFGCGCVTVNYDGKNKHRTIIGDNCFIGCNTNLIAPVKVADDVYIAAGSTVTDDVPENSMCIARARQVIKKDWKLKK